MDKVNIDLTRKLLKEYSHGINAKLIKDRHVDSLKNFLPYIKDPILDIGSRDGILISLLKERGFNDLTGIDVSAEAVEVMNSKGFKAYHADADNMPFENESFQTVSLIHVIEHCRDIKKVVNEVNRVLKIGGYILVEIPIQKKEPVPTKWAHWFCFSNENELRNFFVPTFKQIGMFRQRREQGFKPWVRFVFKKEV
jgi:ubiquinone/menaquinone biosynthesis C-methylase UbiE